MTLHFDLELPTLNEYINMERRNKFEASKFRKKTKTIIKLLTLMQTKERLTSLYDLNIKWIRKNKLHDPDNIYFTIKFILDGIVMSNILPTDGREHIRNIYNNIVDGNKNEVFINFIDVRR